METESRLEVGFQGLWEEGNEQLLLSGTEFLFGVMKKFQQ